MVTYEYVPVPQIESPNINFLKIYVKPVFENAESLGCIRIASCNCSDFMIALVQHFMLEMTHEELIRTQKKNQVMRSSKDFQGLSKDEGYYSNANYSIKNIMELRL